MSKRGDVESLKDIQEAISRIQEYCRDSSLKQFLRDTKTQDAVVRNLEIIGEATRNISAEFKKKHAHVAWKSMAGLRDKLIHHYFGVNWDVVWNIIQEKLPAVKAQIEELL